MDNDIPNGNKLAIALVDHLTAMGNASSCLIPVTDRAEDYVVIVMPLIDYQQNKWPAKYED